MGFWAFKKTIDLSCKKGASIPEIVVGSGLILTSLTILVSHLTSAYSVINKSELVAFALDIESQIISNLGDSQFTAAFSENLRLGTPDVSAIEIHSSNGLLVARNNAEVGVFSNGQACSEVGTPMDQCDIVTTLDIVCNLVGSFQDCKAAYNISFPLTTKNKSAKAPLGSTLPFNAASSTLPITYDIFSNVTKECSGNANILKGINSADGTLTCSEPPDNNCPAGHLAVGFSYDAGAKKFVLNCSEPHQIHCPVDYALHDFSPAALDGRSDPLTNTLGHCIHVTQNTVAWRVTPQANSSITGTFCPASHEVFNVSCNVVNFDTNNGVCAGGIPGPAVSTLEGVNWTKTVTTGVPNPQSASCTVSYPTEPLPCGAYIRTEVQLTGQCRLIPPELVDATNI